VVHVITRGITKIAIKNSQRYYRFEKTKNRLGRDKSEILKRIQKSPLEGRKNKTDSKIHRQHTENNNKMASRDLNIAITTGGVKSLHLSVKIQRLAELDFCRSYMLKKKKQNKTHDPIIC
jgi:hypothetical protein